MIRCCGAPRLTRSETRVQMPGFEPEIVVAYTCLNCGRVQKTREDRPRRPRAKDEITVTLRRTR